MTWSGTDGGGREGGKEGGREEEGQDVGRKMAQGEAWEVKENEKANRNIQEGKLLCGWRRGGREEEREGGRKREGERKGGTNRCENEGEGEKIPEEEFEGEKGGYRKERREREKVKVAREDEYR